MKQYTESDIGNAVYDAAHHEPQWRDESTGAIMRGIARLLNERAAPADDLRGQIRKAWEECGIECSLDGMARELHPVAWTRLARFLRILDGILYEPSTLTRDGDRQ